MELAPAGYDTGFTRGFGAALLPMVLASFLLVHSGCAFARLLLMRRMTWPPPCERDLWRFRVLGAITPDLDHVIAEHKGEPTYPCKADPTASPAAGSAGRCCHCRACGPEMLQMLRGHMAGDNRVSFNDAVENMIARARRSRLSSQMQLI